MFKTYFGNKTNIAILDFLGDHTRYSYSFHEICKNIIGNYIVDSLKNLVKYGLVVKENDKYRINTDNIIIKVVLKYDFEQAKKEADNRGG